VDYEGSHLRLAPVPARGRFVLPHKNKCGEQVLLVHMKPERSEAVLL